MKNPTEPVTIRRSDYRVPDFTVETVDLHFDLHEDHARVRNRLRVSRHPDGRADAPLHLDGEDLTLEQVTLNGSVLSEADYSVNERALSLTIPGDSAELEIITRCEPQNNTRLEGLYKSSGNFCTQCEAEGFRRITYYPDRPDVLAVFTVTIEADAARYPVMLANGNRTAARQLDNGRHEVVWHDPFPKPSYLFALVAGDLACIEDKFTTASGRDVTLHIFVQHHNADKCDYAMQALKHAMAWDEQRFGLEYDLDVYMIVAVDDFNMGAMENKGLNIFNSRFVLADRKTATDTDFEGVESVIAHEYFHNWTGNRVTCRDWFQLSLKEGLTVFRDQEFSADMNDRAVKRIDDVRQLRARQFPEDAGPMAHPIRPDAYIEINNFYTATVYEKGAEVIRMMHTLLGESGFRKGMDLYFKRHDGQAVTCEDFVSAMEDASGVDLRQFRLWYSQAGTPTLRLSTDWDETAGRFQVTVSQACKTQPDNKPCHIPLVTGLLGDDGQALPLQCEEQPLDSDCSEAVLHLTEAEQTFTFTGLSARPVLSTLRGFSAPVILDAEQSAAELAHLMRYDSDSFNRWEAAQALATRAIEAAMQGDDDQAAVAYIDALQPLLADNTASAALRAEALTLPALEAIADRQAVVDIDAIHAARSALRERIANTYAAQFKSLYVTCRNAAGEALDATAMGVRRLYQVCMQYLSCLPAGEWLNAALAQYHESESMTDRLAVLRVLSHTTLDARDTLLADFYQQWKGNRLVTDKWFTLQAISQRESAVDDVIALTAHPDFELGNPNRVRSLVAAFAMSNPLRFHQADGRGYVFLADYIIKLDKTNPQLAARLVAPLSRWRRYDEARQSLMREQLARIKDSGKLSPDVFEIVQKSLGKD
ncbi:aminopeptidase N [Granulosicoccaceae sp. 1_MG-2023]|nr:aminopeptidase N [Granulosicoccaceae sp. 1_MG-2023]